jgi:penicillin V acylase-like amidase (Ntn superfamily)
VCTRVLWNTNRIAVLTGRTMDWSESTEPLIVAFPRGLGRDGGLVLGEIVVPENPLRSTSTHASLATTLYGNVTDRFASRQIEFRFPRQENPWVRPPEPAASPLPSSP